MPLCRLPNASQHLSPPRLQEAKAIFGSSPSFHRVSPLRRGIPPLRRPLRRREGGGSPPPACTYGRLGWSFCRRRPGGGGAAGGWFGGGAVFSGGGSLRSSPSSCSSCRRSRPGVVLGAVCFPSDPRRRRIWWPVSRDARVLQVLQRRIRRWLGFGGVAEPGGRPPWRSSTGAPPRRGGQSMRASFKGQMFPRQWQDGGCCASSSSPVKLVIFELVLAPLPRVCSSFVLSMYCCMWIPGEYTW